MKRMLSLNMLPASGGTIVARYFVASGWLLNSEIHPYVNRPSNTFCPNKFSDVLITRLEDEFGTSLDLRLFKQRSFLAEIELSLELAEFYSRPLVLRGWHHPNFTQDKPLLDDVGARILMNSKLKRFSELVVIRNPIDNYLSFRKNADWAQWLKSKNPAAEFMKRYLCFVEYYSKRDAKFTTYEAFCKNPSDLLSLSCALVQINVKDLASTDIEKVKLSGASGRQGDKISLRPREVLEEREMRDIKNNKFYENIVSLLPFYNEIDR
ncbi:MAG: hypothetical protein VW421_00760 [Gammaproteobacteria bacterium]